VSRRPRGGGRFLLDARGLPEDTGHRGDTEGVAHRRRGAYYFDLRAVVANGDATRVEDADLEARIEREWCRKYFDRDERPEFMDLLYQGRPWVWCRVDPTRWTSWDNSKIDLEKLREVRG
jgi:hypothetical protein